MVLVLVVLAADATDEVLARAAADQCELDEYARALVLAEVVRQQLAVLVQATAALAEQVRAVADLSAQVSDRLDRVAARVERERDQAMLASRADNRPFSIWRA